MTRPDDTRSPSAGLAHARAEQPRALLGIHRYGRIASRVRTWAGSHYADERLAGPALPALFVGAMAMLPGGAAWLLQAPIHDLAGLPPSSSRPEVATMIGLPALGYGAHAVREMFAPLVVLACVIAASYLAEQAPRLLSRRRVAQSVPAASLPVALIPSIRRAAWWRGVGAWPTGSMAGLRRLSLPVPTAASQALGRLWASRKMSLLLLYWICLPALLLALAL